MSSNDIFTNVGNAWSIVLTFCLVVSTLFSVVLLTLPKEYEAYKDRPLKVTSKDGKKINAKSEDAQNLPVWKQGKTVQVVVLGDIGRSPRMQYHALSIAKHGGRVFLIGYQGKASHYS